MIKKFFLFFCKKDLTRSLKMNYNYYNGRVLLKKKKKKKQISSFISREIFPAFAAPTNAYLGRSSQLFGGEQGQALLLAFFPTKKRVDSPLPFFWQLDLITRLGSNYCPIFNFSFSPSLYYNYIISCQINASLFEKFFHKIASSPLVPAIFQQLPLPTKKQQTSSSIAWAKVLPWRQHLDQIT